MNIVWAPTLIRLRLTLNDVGDQCCYEHLRKQFVHFPLYVEAFCGRWAYANTQHAIRTIPATLASPLLTVLSVHQGNQTIYQGHHLISREVVPVVLYAINVIVYTIRVLFANGVLTPLTIYTTKSRWPHVIPPLLTQLQQVLSNTINSLPAFMTELEHVSSTWALENVLQLLLRVIEKECAAVNERYYSAYQARPYDFVGADNQQNPDLWVAANRPLPDALRREIYVPHTSPYTPSYTVEDLMQAFYEPASTVSIRGIAYYTYLSELWRENQPVWQIASQQPTPPAQTDRGITITAPQVHATSPPLSAIDLCSMETASTGSARMAQNTSQTPVEAPTSTPPRATTTTTASAQTTAPAETEASPVKLARGCSAHDTWTRWQQSWHNYSNVISHRRSSKRSNTRYGQYNNR